MKIPVRSSVFVAAVAATVAGCGLISGFDELRYIDEPRPQPGAGGAGGTGDGGHGGSLCVSNQIEPCYDGPT